MSVPFTSFDQFRDLLSQAAGIDQASVKAAAARNRQLTKPRGALGQLEDLAQWVAGWQKTEQPHIVAPQIVIFAANHGVCAQGVSAFPQEVTAQMVTNFQTGGAAINQLARVAGAKLDVVALELERPTQDFTTGPAMTEAEVIAALQAGWQAVDPATDLLVVGEMGIGNTTSAAALLMALFGGAAEEWTGYGTGVDNVGLSRKTQAVAQGVACNAAALTSSLQILRCLGGREIAAMVGAMARARVDGIPTILDGYICSAAASVLAKTAPGALDHAVAGHVSAEGPHVKVLERLGKRPLLSLGLRLGEGSGAALAMPIVLAAVACHSGMATFEEAAVSDA